MLKKFSAEYGHDKTGTKSMFGRLFIFMSLPLTGGGIIFLTRPPKILTSMILQEHVVEY